MNILRLSTLSLTLAMAVFGFGYTNTAFADKPGGGGHNHDDDEPGFPTGLTVQFSGGAFVSVNPSLGVTAEAEVKLGGDEPLRMIRPGFDPALQSWNNVFDLCGLLGQSGMVEVAEFTAPDGRKGWTVEKVLEEVWVPLQFPLDSPLVPSDPLFTDRLTAGMQLKGACPPPACSLIPDDIEEVMNSGESTLTIVLDRYAIHLRGKGGVTHEAICHADSGVIGEKVGPPTPTNLVITRILTP